MSCLFWLETFSVSRFFHSHSVSLYLSLSLSRPLSIYFFVSIVSDFADIYGGYVCFVVSIFAIGLVTAVIGDVASHFGCTLGIKDSVTAIVFVALGTSVPGTEI